MAAAPQVTPPPRVDTPEVTPYAATAPPPMVDPQGDISFQPGHATIQSPQRAPQIIPDDT